MIFDKKLHCAIPRGFLCVFLFFGPGSIDFSYFGLHVHVMPSCLLGCDDSEDYIWGYTCLFYCNGTRIAMLILSSNVNVLYFPQINTTCFI